MFTLLNSYNSFNTKYNEHYCYAYIWSVKCKYAQ